MSAIFGLVGLRGRPVDRRDLDTMSATLERHGPDGAGAWADQHVGLGQRLRCATPEDRVDRQPLRSADGHRTLVYDGRLDTRAELTAALGLDLVSARAMPDSAFVLRAYEKWGEACVRHLVGAFAFALWDAVAQHLVIARSPMGERPLYYHAGSDDFVFATAPKGLFALRWVPRELDEQFLADYLARERAEPGTSFYRHIRRLVPGDTLVVARDRHLRLTHWPQRPGREIRFARDEDYVEAFDEVFTRVVGDYLRSDSKVGLMLSGGFDSSSVAVTAAPLLEAAGERLLTFTEVPRRGFDGALIKGRYADETPFVRALAERHDNLEPNFIDTTGRFFLDDLDRQFEAADVPYRYPSNRVWHEALLDAARGKHVGVMLNAVNGNMTISWNGSGLLAQLVKAGRWHRAWREARALAARRSASTLRALIGQGVVPLLPLPLYLAIERARHPAEAVGWSRHPWRAFSAINSTFAADHRVYERARANVPDFRLRLRFDVREQRYQTIVRAAEVHDGLYAGYEALFDVESRDPTGDLRLIEFCLSLPEDQYLRDGQERRLVRRTMKNRLPREILDNPKRGFQAADWFERMLAARSRLAEEIGSLERCDLARRAIDLTRLRRLVERMPDASPGADTTLNDYRGALEFGVVMGRFIRWFQESIPPRAAA